MNKRAEKEMTWAGAVIRALVIVSLLIIFLGFIPSIIRYQWGNHADQMAAFIHDKTGFEFKDTYTMIRIHDAISMGLQTFIFAVPIAATYILGERRRRRLGLRGNEGVKGYLPGK